MKRIGVINGRFQVLHLKHMEYILAAKMKCDKLYIGITNPDPRLTKADQADPNRSTKSANPLTYLERSDMLKGSLREFKVPDSEYEIIPFPINFPEYILNYSPSEAVYYVGICDEWDRKKKDILESLNLNVEVLWEKNPEDKGISAAKVREAIALEQPWKEYVPNFAADYIESHDLVKRITRLEKIRIDEKATNDVDEDRTSLV